MYDLDFLLFKKKKQKHDFFLIFAVHMIRCAEVNCLDFFVPVCDCRLQPGDFSKHSDHLPCLPGASLEEGDRQTRQGFQADCVSLSRPKSREERQSVRAMTKLTLFLLFFLFLFYNSLNFCCSLVTSWLNLGKGTATATERFLQLLFFLMM